MSFGQNAPADLRKYLAREPQGKVECALVIQMACTHRSENILTNEEMTVAGFIYLFDH